MQGKRGLIMGLANERSLAWGIARAVHAQSMQISLTGRNLLKWTNYDGIDPELNGNGQSDLPDDFLTAPPIRTLAVRVSLGY